MPTKRDNTDDRRGLDVERDGVHEADELEETPDVISDPGVEGGVDAPNEESETEA